MLSYHDLKSNPRVLRAFTSLDPAEFEMLLIPFEKAWQNYINRYYIHKKSRKRRYGGGRKPHLVAIVNIRLTHSPLQKSSIFQQKLV
jgi:hypothetical protein